jgi:phage portal protein BeeE
MLLISNKKWDSLNQQVKAMQSSNLAAAFNNFSTQIFPTWRVIQEMDAYQTMAFIYAVVSKLATTSAMIPFYAYDKVKDTDMPEGDKLVTFLEKLDFEQKELLYTYLYLTGEVFMYKERIEVGVNAGVNSVKFLNPGKVVVVLSESFPIEVIGYRYLDSENGLSFDIPKEDIVFIKLPNPSTVQADEFRGLSPVKVLTRTITRMQAGEAATVAQLQNGGGKDIVYDKTPNLDVTVLGKRKDGYGRFARNSDNVGAPYFAQGEMGVIHLGSSLTDLEVTALAAADQSMVCNVFGISKVLFNDTAASTESNVQEMVKEMYTNTVIPNVTRVESKMNKDIVPDIKTKGIIQADYSGIKALQDDETKKAAALAAKWWLTANEKREADSYDQITNNPLMDEIIIPSSMMLMSDLEIVVEPVDNAAGDYRAPVVPLKQANG